jgi:tetratricopeptide (TPR) repeat protein
MPQQTQRRPGVTQLLEEAESELTSGNAVAALSRTQLAFEQDPSSTLAVALLDRIFDTVTDPATLLAVGESSPSPARQAARARLMMKVGIRLQLGRHFEAIEALISAIEQAPDLPFTAWLAPWLDNQACRAIGLDRFRPLVLTLTQFAARSGVPTTGGEPATPEQLPALRGAAAIVCAVRSAYPSEPRLWSAEALIRRRLSNPQATLAVATEGARRFPDDWSNLVALANAWGDAGKPDEALRVAERAVYLIPSDGSPLFDVGAAFLHWGYAKEAARVFSELLVRFENYPGAAEALLRARSTT